MVSQDLAFGKDDTIVFANKCYVGDADVNSSGYFLVDDEEKEEATHADNFFFGNSNGTYTFIDSSFYIECTLLFPYCVFRFYSIIKWWT